MKTSKAVEYFLDFEILEVESHGDRQILDYRLELETSKDVGSLPEPLFL